MTATDHVMWLERSALGTKVWLRCDCGWVKSVWRHQSIKDLVALHGGVL